MIRAGFALLFIVVVWAFASDDDFRAEERQAAHVAERSKAIAQRHKSLTSDAKWAELQLKADEVWPAKLASRK